MMKRRFKKALFAFFKEEILNSVGLNESSKSVKIVEVNSDIIELKTEIMLNERDITFQREPSFIVYEKALDRAKEKLFNEFLNFVDIEKRSVLDSGIYDNRQIKLSVLIAKRKSN